MKDVLSAIMFAFIVVAPAYSQDAAPKTVSAGILNARAQSLPKPVYPADARRANIDGTVKVHVVVDENGKVVSAKAIAGPASVSLRQAAETAALQAKFAPMLLSGKPAKVSGMIHYEFVLTGSNEKKLKVLGISMFLTLTREFASDPEIGWFDAYFEMGDMINEAVSEFPEFAGEFRSLTSLKKLPVSQRLVLIDKALSSIHAKSSEVDRWQFEVGKDFGEFMAALMRLIQASGDNEPDFSRLDNSALKAKLGKMRKLMLAAPNDFPEDVRAKFRDLCAMAETEKLTTPENLKALVEKMMALMETISPESAK